MAVRWRKRAVGRRAAETRYAGHAISHIAIISEGDGGRQKQATDAVRRSTTRKHNLLPRRAERRPNVHPRRSSATAVIKQRKSQRMPANWAKNITNFSCAAPDAAAALSSFANSLPGAMALSIW